MLNLHVHVPIFHTSDPVPDPRNPGHYMKFEDAYGTTTSEKHRPSLSQKKGKLPSEKEAGFRVNAEKVKVMIHCEECKKPR